MYYNKPEQILKLETKLNLKLFDEKIKLIGVNNFYTLNDNKDCISLNIKLYNEDKIYFLKDIPTLEKLTIKCNFKNLSKLKILTQLKELNLTNSNIENIDEIYYLKKLKSLDLSLNKIYDISSLKELIELESLNLTSNQIKEIKDLKNLILLEKLKLGDNKIDDISIIHNLLNLKELVLFNNKISKIQNFEKLSNLVKLDIRSNEINDINEYKFALFLNNLVELKLSPPLFINPDWNFNYTNDIKEYLNKN